MSSFAALHLQGSESELLPWVDEWALTLGFGKRQAFAEPPTELQRFHLSVKMLALLTLNADWCILYLNGFTLPKRTPVGLESIEPLAARCPHRSLLFVAQTTSDCYELAAFDAGRKIRHLMYADGERSQDFGDRLPGESGNTFAPISDHDEESTPMEDASAICSALGFELWGELRGPGHAWRRRGLLQRWLAR